MNNNATNRLASSPADSGGLVKVPGDWHETMSTHWFHDHMFSFTAHNVYKGIAGMFNIYSGLDRGNEEIDDGVNLRLPSGTARNPDLSRIPVARQRVFEFGRDASQTSSNPVTSFSGDWGIRTDNDGPMLNADFGRISAAPKYKTVRMPNLNLSEQEAGEVLAYVQSQASRPGAPKR